MPDGPLLHVEILPASAESPSSGVTLGGAAAREVAESLSAVLAESAWKRRRTAKRTYRLVASEQARSGLADGSLRWATARKGDASVLIKDTATGRITGSGQLERVRTSPAKLLGPAVWEALAMATQQHFLVEINQRLQSIEKGVSEVLSRMDDDKRGTLAGIRRTVESASDRLAGSGELPEGRARELRDSAQRADEVWHQLRERVARHLHEYGEGARAAEEVEHSWAMLLYATQVLVEASALLTALPYDTVEGLEDAVSDERERVHHAIDGIRVLADQLHAAHLRWAADNADWHFRRTRNPVRQVARTIKGTRVPRPHQRPLDYATAWHASQLAAPPQPPAALLVSVNGDETVTVAPAIAD